MPGCPGQPFLPVGQPKVDPWLPDRATKSFPICLCNYAVGQPQNDNGCQTGQPIYKTNVKPWKCINSEARLPFMSTSLHIASIQIIKVVVRQPYADRQTRTNITKTWEFLTYNRRFFKVGGPMNKILVLRNKRVFKGLVMLWSSFGGTSRNLFLQVGQAFDWLNFKMANDMSVYSFDSVHQKLKSKRREQGTENDV